MKKLLILFLCLNFSSCLPDFLFERDDDDCCERPKSNYDPNIIKRSALDDSISFESNVAVSESSKIYIFSDYIFINDNRKGFHIYDNTDPANPVKRTFLNIPGATDIAIRNNVFYVNQATDLVSLTIDPDALTYEISKRLENVFPELLSPDGFEYFTDEDEIVVNWKEK